MIVYKVNDNNITFSIYQYNNNLPLVDKLNLCKLIYQYRKIFCDFLPESLLPKQEIKHVIKIDNVKPININAYLLSKTHMDEQVKKVTNLFNKRLI